MAVRFYDEAITKKIQSWMPVNTDIKVLKPNESARLFQMLADEGNDQPLKLPLVAISRDPSINVSVPTKRPLTFNGVRISEYTGEEIPDETKVMQLDAIPIVINYQIDVYTRKYEEADEYVRNFIFNFVNYPKMVVDIPYNNANIQHICYMRLQSTVTDNSDIPQKLFSDQFTRWTFEIRIDDAYLFSVPIKDTVRVGEAVMDISADVSDPSLKLVLADEEGKIHSEEIIEL